MISFIYLGSSVGIRSALNVPKSSNFVNEQIRGSPRSPDDVVSPVRISNLGYAPG